GGGGLAGRGGKDMSRVVNLRLGFVSAIVVLTGCTTGPARKPATAGSLTVPPETAQKYQDPIAASALRERALDMLTSMVQDKDPQLRANAIEAMSVTPVRLESLLGPALRDENPGVRSTAAQMIGKAQLRDKGSMDELINLSARRSGGQYWPAEIRLGVAGALARMGLDKGTFLADEYAGNDLPVLRAQAAYVYGEIGRPENLPKLDVLMDDPAG